MLCELSYSESLTTNPKTLVISLLLKVSTTQGTTVVLLLYLGRHHVNKIYTVNTKCVKSNIENMNEIMQEAMNMENPIPHDVFL